jgi:tetratricopeptide (TPR) repeat protein
MTTKRPARSAPGAALILLFTSLLLLGAQFALGQRGFGETEKKLVDKFKRSDARFQKGKALFAKEKYDQAEKELKTCLEMMPEHADAYFLLAQINYRRGDFVQALADVEKAESNYEFIGQFYTYTHQLRLEQLRDDKMKLESQLSLLRDELAKARTAEDRQKIQSAMNPIQSELANINTRLNEPLPDVLEAPADYYYVHGNIQFKLRRYQEARSEYLEAIKIDRKHALAYNNLVSLDYMAGNYEEALKTINQAELEGVQLNPKLREAVLKAAKK